MKRLTMLAVAFAAIALLAPATAGAATLTRLGDTLRYVASPGEVNDLNVSRGFLFVPMIRFNDDGATITTDDPLFCNVVEGDGFCTLEGVNFIFINVKDKNDAVTIDASQDEELAVPSSISTRLIGGRGIDIMFGGNGFDKLKGNAGRDALRGRKGRDKLKGGKGSDQLYALDGLRDRVIRCGFGNRDQVKFDRGLDPRPRACELPAGGPR
jgi:Ca2+-binding RTX toxin-like protein